MSGTEISRAQTAVPKRTRPLFIIRSRENTNRLASIFYASFSVQKTRMDFKGCYGIVKKVIVLVVYEFISNQGIQFCGSFGPPAPPNFGFP